MFYRNFAYIDNSGAWYMTIPSWVEMILLGVALIANYVGLVIYIYKRCFSKKNTVIESKQQLG
jgi:hypothetical protein